MRAGARVPAFPASRAWQCGPHRGDARRRSGEGEGKGKGGGGRGEGGGRGGEGRGISGGLVSGAPATSFFFCIFFIFYLQVSIQCDDGYHLCDGCADIATCTGTGMYVCVCMYVYNVCVCMYICV